jgi:prolyl 4-hydroxylase
MPLDLPIEQLDELQKPIISFIHETHGTLKAGNFILITNIDGSKIEYLHIRKGWIKEDISVFKSYWAGVVMVITSADPNNFGEKDFETKELAYFDKINNNPDRSNVKIFDDILTDEECQYIINLSNQNFERSKLSGDTLIEDFGRTSFTANLVFPEDAILNAIREKASKLINVPASHFEFFQCVSYEPGQEYMNHFDTFDDKHETGRKALADGGQRKYTLLAYLNDDFTGGGTHFPNLDFLVQPKKGRIVMFNNLDENGNVINAAYHAGLPVSSGRKYAINMWVREKPISDR